MKVENLRPDLFSISCESEGSEDFIRLILVTKLGFDLRCLPFKHFIGWSSLTNTEWILVKSKGRAGFNKSVISPAKVTTAHFLVWVLTRGGSKRETSWNIWFLTLLQSREYWWEAFSWTDRICWRSPLNINGSCKQSCLGWDTNLVIFSWELKTRQWWAGCERAMSWIAKVTFWNKHW